MIYSYMGYKSGKWSETFYKDVKTTERVKKQTIAKNMADFKCK